jgi:hypothetical protein
VKLFAISVAVDVGGGGAVCVEVGINVAVDVGEGTIVAVFVGWAVSVCRRATSIVASKSGGGVLNMPSHAAQKNSASVILSRVWNFFIKSSRYTLNLCMSAAYNLNLFSLSISSTNPRSQSLADDLVWL